jgi:regulator of nucleoside diphosphate kinase
MLPALPEVFIPVSERMKLTAVVERANRWAHPVAYFLQSELRRARFCSVDALPPGTVVMNGWVSYCVDWEQPRNLKLVYPRDYTGAEEQLSLLSPLGAALIGLRAGDRMPFLTLDETFRLVTVMDAKPDAPTFAHRVRDVNAANDTDDPFDSGPHAA